MSTALQHSGWGRMGERKPLLALEATKDGMQLPNTYVKAQMKLQSYILGSLPNL